MGSPIMFSGFHQIDFDSILNAIMAAERAPLTALETQRTALNQQGTAFTTLASKLGALKASIDTLSGARRFSAGVACSSSEDRVGVSTTSGCIPGIYALGNLHEDVDEAQNRLDEFVTAHNDLMSFITEQNAAAAAGKTSIARDLLVRSLRTGLRDAMQAEYANPGTHYTRLSTIGVELDAAGSITLNTTRLTEAVKDNADAVRELFVGATGTGGVFGALKARVEAYTKAGGLVQGAKDRLEDQILKIDSRLDTMEMQLELRRATLQQEFIAADRLMTQLNSQGSSLQALGGQYRLF